MTRRIYPLNALRDFEASARHLSFVRAAEELHVTPAAISHQVKRLEEYLGMPLFRRLPRAILLSQTGELLLSNLREVFLRLDKAVEHVMEGNSRGALTISVAPIFAVKWLVPRLHWFDALHPDIDVRMSSSLRVIDFQSDAVDAAVRLGRGEYPGLEAVKLFEESVTPMCSPQLLAGTRALRDPDDLRHQVLLHDDSTGFDPAAPNWDTWLRAAGAERVDAARGPRFSHPDLALQAAVGCGAGLAAPGRGRRRGRPAGTTVQPVLATSFCVLLGLPGSRCKPREDREIPRVVVERDGGREIGVCRVTTAQACMIPAHNPHNASSHDAFNLSRSNRRG
jgi:LysR family glycine cleavage system transcriptional activator